MIRRALAAVLVALLFAASPPYAAQAKEINDGDTFRGLSAITDVQGPHAVIAHNNDEWQWLWKNKIGRVAPGSLPRGSIAVAGFLGYKSITGYGVRMIHDAAHECDSCPNLVNFIETDPSAMTPLRRVDNSPYEILIVQTDKKDVTIHYGRRFDSAYMPQRIRWLPLYDDSTSFFSWIPHAIGESEGGDAVENMQAVYTDAPADSDQAMHDGKIAEDHNLATFNTNGWDYAVTYDQAGHAAWVAH